MTEWLALRTTELARLAALGLQPEHFEFFQQRFVGHPFHFIRWQPEDKRPHTVNRPLTNSALVRHLEGHSIYGTGCRWDANTQRYRTDYFCIDLDAHEEPGAVSLWHRYDAVASVLGPPTLTFRSSLSGGLHLYYFLDASYDLHDLRSPEGDGAVIRALLNVELQEEFGEVEVYPRGKYKVRGQQNRLRLPFGLNSRLLDPFDLSLPLTSGPIQDLKVAYDQFAHGEMRFLSLQELQLLGSSVQPIQPYTRQRYRRRASSTPEMTRFPNGLERAGQLNAALVDQSIQLVRTGMVSEEASVALGRWLDDNHNGVSRTYNHSRDDAHAEADDILRRVYKRQDIRFPRKAQMPGLTSVEFLRLVHATWDDASLTDPYTGEVYPRYRVQSFLFDLIRGAKQWVQTRTNSARDCLLVSTPDVDPDSEDFAEQLASDCQGFQPDPIYPLYLVPVPYVYREALAGYSENSQLALWRIAQQLRFFVLYRRASADAHRAAIYYSVLDFGHFGSSGTCSSLAIGLLSCMDADALREKYSRHYLKKIRRDAIAAALAHSPEDDPGKVAEWVDGLLKASRKARTNCASISLAQAEPLRCVG